MTDCIGTLLPPYQPSIHEREIAKYFGGVSAMINDAKEAGPCQAIRSLIICFSNRSGSSLLAEGLAMTGVLGRGGESFNCELALRVCRRLDIRKLSEYVRYRQQQQGCNNKVFCLKLGWAQLYFLLKIRCIPLVISNPLFLWIRRKDVLGQAISFSIAAQTKRWASVHKDSAKEVQYDENDIRARMRGILTSTLHFEEFFAIAGQPYYELYYEDLVSDFPRSIAAICEWLSVEPLKVPSIEEMSRKRQSSSLNEEFKGQFLRKTRSLVEVAEQLGVES